MSIFTVYKYKMPTYTSSLPQHLLEKLSSLAREYSLPKNKIIEKALDLYLTEIDKAAYAASFKRAKGDKDLLIVAEEGMTDYYKQLDSLDEAS